MDEELDHKKLILEAYTKHNVKFHLYEGDNRFHGTPIPEGYEAIYINDGFFPDSLQLMKVK